MIHRIAASINDFASYRITLVLVTCWHTTGPAPTLRARWSDYVTAGCQYDVISSCAAAAATAVAGDVKGAHLYAGVTHNLLSVIPHRSQSHSLITHDPRHRHWQWPSQKCEPGRGALDLFPFLSLPFPFLLSLHPSQPFTVPPSSLSS